MKNYGFRGFEHCKLNVEPYKVFILTSLTEDTSKSENVLLNQLFAPDPVTGNPSSNLPLMADDDSDIGRFIRDHFTRSVPSSRGTDDPDLALELVSHGEFESSKQYLERIRNFMKERYIPKVKKDDPKAKKDE